MENCVIIDGLRTPIGVKKGQLVGIRADDLCAQLLNALMERNPQIKKEEVEDIVLGCAFPEHTQGMLMGRAVGLLAGFPQTTCGKVVNRFCGSSMDAVHQISNSIKLKDIDCAIAIGVEDMISIPIGGFNPSFHSKLIEIGYYMGMGETAENLVKELNISSEEQEEFSIESHKKALKAWAEGKFKNEVVPIKYNGKIIEKDEGPKEPDIEKIKSLEPAFLKDGTITAATSSPISIGAGALILTSEKFAKEHNLKIRAYVISGAIAGVDPKLMGSGPIPASEKLLKKLNLKIDDIDFIELNEAFAAQSLYVLKKTGWDRKKVNVNGGAIALGHPLGASGARILVTLLNVLEQNNAKRGLATMCIGTGMGIATIIERG